METNWLQGAKSSLLKVLVQKAEDFILAQMPSDNSGRYIEKDLDYFTIRIRSSRVVNTRRWTSTFYGAIHSCVSYLHFDHGRIEFNSVIVPDKMRQLDPAHIDRVIQVDKPVIGPVPYLGELSLELGLFSVKGVDLAAPYLELLTSIADKSGIISTVSTARLYVDTLRKGVDLLFGNDRICELEIGVDHSWPKLQIGTWLIMRAKKGTVDLDHIGIDPIDGGIIREDGTPFRDYAYVVFSIEASRRRDDWMTIPDLKAAWDNIVTAVRRGQTDDAEHLLANFALITRASPELVPDDAGRLARKAESMFGRIQPRTVMAARKSDDAPFPEFADLDLYDEAAHLR